MKSSSPHSSQSSSPRLRPASKEEYDAFFKRNPLIVPSGKTMFRNGYTQCEYLLDGRVVARLSMDSQGRLYDIAE